MTNESLLDVFDTTKDGEIQAINAYVQEYFSPEPLEVYDTQRTDTLGCTLAPSFGTLNKDSVLTMDNGLKVILSGTLRTLRNIPEGDRTWDTIMQAVRQNALLETTPPDEVTRVDSLIKEGQYTFKFDGSPDAAIVKEVEAWFDKLISDRGIREATKIDINVVAKIVAQTGATVTGFLSVFKKEEYHERVLVDIGVLRFPEPSHPFIKFYRIQLKAWSYCDRVLANQEYRNGITGEFNSRRFRPRKSVIDELSSAVLQKGVDEAESLFK